MKKYILYSTLFAIFTEVLVIKGAIDFKLIYVIFLINYVFLFALNKIVIPKFYGIIFFYLAASATIGCLFNTDTVVLALQQIIGIFISSLYFYNVYRYVDIPVGDIFDKYVKIAVFLSFVGIVIFAINIARGDHEYRLQSLMQEPAHFVAITLPAFYFLLKNYRNYKVSFWLVAIALALSGSSTGYICILLCAIVYNKNIFVLKNLVIYAVSFATGIILYLTVDSVKIRIDDTFTSSQNFDVTGANWSTYALVSNLFVTQQVLSHSPVIGNGIGSHVMSHEKYVRDLIGFETLTTLQDLNAKDADSLALRVLSDLGFLGFFLVCFFILKIYVKTDDSYVISRALIIYFFYKLFREGEYFSPEMYFFVMGYYFCYLQNKKAFVTGRSAIQVT